MVNNWECHAVGLCCVFSGHLVLRQVLSMTLNKHYVFFVVTSFPGPVENHGGQERPQSRAGAQEAAPSPDQRGEEEERGGEEEERGEGESVKTPTRRPSHLTIPNIARCNLLVCVCVCVCVCAYSCQAAAQLRVSVHSTHGHTCSRAHQSMYMSLCCCVCVCVCACARARRHVCVCMFVDIRTGVCVSMHHCIIVHMGVVCVCMCVCVWVGGWVGVFMKKLTVCACTV